jgi:hypothetical protein
MSRVAALYIDPRGPYPKLLGLEMCWDETRDARLYNGPFPVVAHPPCGPWTRNAFASKQDPSCGIKAFEQVRSFGGVLEQPAHSKLFDRCGAPKPDEPPDQFGGLTIEVEQCNWGHVARKRMWLYMVGVRDLPEMPPPREPTHWCRKRPGQVMQNGIKMCSKEQRRRTPPAFAELLVALASRVKLGPKSPPKPPR